MRGEVTTTLYHMYHLDCGHTKSWHEHPSSSQHALRMWEAKI